MSNWLARVWPVAILVILSSGCTKSTLKSYSVKSFSEFAVMEAVTNPRPAQSPNCTTSCQSLRQEFRYVVYVGQQIYCYWDLKQSETHADYTGLAAQLEQSITDQTSLSQYYLVLRKWAASFHDGHVFAVPTDLTQLEVYSAPVRLEVLAPATDHEQVVVVNVKDVPGLRVGSVVTAINGVPVQQVLDQKESEINGSTPRMRRYHAGQHLVDAIGADQGAIPLVLTVADGSSTGATFTIARDVQIQPRTGPASINSIIPSGADTGVKNLSVVKVLAGGIGYVRIDGFGGSQEAALFEQVMDRMADTNWLILDLRHNGGGDLSGNQILAHLATHPIVRYKQSERWSDFTLNQRPQMFGLAHILGAPFADWHDVLVVPNPQHYSKPVVALIGPYCFSACDTFSAGLKGNGLATFVGEGTGGGTGTPLIFPLPVSQWLFGYSVIRGQRPDGTTLEGGGTLPDISFEPSIRDRVTGEDSQLTRAIQAVNDKNSTTPQPISADDLHEIAPMGMQRLDISPTQADVDDLLSRRGIDEL